MQEEQEAENAQEEPKQELMDSIAVKTIKKKQEEVIRSIVLKSAVFQKDLREYDPEKDDQNVNAKTGAYKEEFIQSICNKSGVFVQEFREIKDPYVREEFIMSIHLNNAKFDHITTEKQQEIFNATI